MKWTILIALMIAAGGCSTRHMDTAMESWRGAHVDEVIKAWGYPARDLMVANHRLYVWTTNNCERTLDVDATGVVRSWEHAGKGCPLFKSDVRQYARPESSALAVLYQSMPGPTYGSSPIARAKRARRME